MVFQIDEKIVERSSTLTKRDIGKWAFVICGCIQLTRAKSYEEALEIYRYVHDR